MSQIMTTGSKIMTMSQVRIAALSALLVFTSAGADVAAEPGKEEKISSAATTSRQVLDFDGRTFSGPAWDRLVAEGKAAQFFLVGEEHGIAENPKLVAQLFSELSNHGYSKLAIEISPTMASLLDAALVDDGLDGLRELFSEPGGEPAFFGMAEEAEMLAAVRAAVPASRPVLWGTDYEVAGDRQLLQLLERAKKPVAAQAALDNLVAASAASWAEYEETGSPQFIFSFAGDPALVLAVREVWPNPDPRSAVILNTLEKTLLINNLWIQGRAWESNLERSALMRENFLRHWHAAKQSGAAPRVMAKYGASHMVRGHSQTAVYDLGTLLPEIAAIEGGHSFSLLVVPGAGSSLAGLNPSTWSYEPHPAGGGYLNGLEPLMTAAVEDAFTLIDLAALRPVVGMSRNNIDDELFRIIHGFDMLLVLSGSTPSGELHHD
jgi:hypothetical protein